MSKQERLLSLIKAPHVSEKAAIAAQSGSKFVFKVSKDASKPEIKEAVETLFGVQVAAVNTVLVKGKTKMFRGRAGRRSDWKKAYITLADGQSLELMTGE
jgi:large subunit ribosomal protein L23